MPLIAERFLLDDEGCVDLATGESIRLSVEHAAACARDRFAACDRLVLLRHPLLLPLIDYGAVGDFWFEAHANLAALRVPGIQARDCAVHLVRFLRSAGIELDAATAARNVRPAVEASAPGWRPIGISLQPRPALESIRTVLEANGPPGVTTITIYGAHGSGLRTARLQVARAARQAGYLVIDSRFGQLQEAISPPRHLCVIDWMAGDRARTGAIDEDPSRTGDRSRSRTGDEGRSRTAATELPLPTALVFAGDGGGRRHAWIRFCRHPVAGAGTIGLEPIMTRDLTNAIYLDGEIGPSAAEIRCAVAVAGGHVGRFIDALSATKRGRPQPGWVHETAPEYVATPRAVPSAARTQSAGVARLLRAVAAASALARRGRHARAARVLARCSGALAARGATAEAASASVTLGELHFDRGRLADAETAFRRAREWAPARATTERALLGTGRVLLEQGRLGEAEGALRTALLCVPASHRAAVRQTLARVLLLRGRLEAAEEALGESDDASLATIRRLQGDLADAARAARSAVASAPAGDAAAVCEAHLAAAQVDAALGDAEAVKRHTAIAIRAARDSRRPALRLCAIAEATGCLERVGVPASSRARTRLLRVSERLSPLSGARVRAAVGAATTADEPLVPTSRDNGHLIQHFRALLAAIHDAPDETAALQLIADDLLRSVSACSVVIRSAALDRQVAGAGRPWPEAEACVRPVLDGSGTVLRDGLTPDAAEPIAAGGSILGALAARWVPGTRPPLTRLRDVLRTASAAAAPSLKCLHALHVVEPQPGVTFPDDLLGRGAAAEVVRDAIRRAALAPYPVLIEGESGSGKELVARAIHARSIRRARKFCAVNCAALTDDLLEAELFGHARGAFTGAVGERPGLFEEADQGTIFLDEAGELTPRAQAKLLRVLQEGEIRRVGENLPRKVDARVVAATNRRLEEEVGGGRFRADLRFRLDVIRITVPPLRERADDIPWLAQRIWIEAASRVGTRASLGEEVLAALARYDWPGNVRELQNVIAALAVHGPRRGRVPAALLPPHIARMLGVAAVGFDEARLEFERRFVRAALARAGGRRVSAATQLGVTRQGLSKIIKRLGIIEA